MKGKINPTGCTEERFMVEDWANKEMKRWARRIYMNPVRLDFEIKQQSRRAPVRLDFKERRAKDCEIAQRADS
jgi:hypothetical protein